MFPKDVNAHVTRDFLADDHFLIGGVCLGQQDALSDVRVGDAVVGGDSLNWPSPIHQTPVAVPGFERANHEPLP
ncbi:hypothetical protein B0G84_8746 [Paraburkholderia sp. BL8N3]|nr:hypothetical protein [Paraburkholderia sp. BL8N3]TCK32844.1 hypothetical protein B0G84_8746 [Paraburkholderia sp. BL8N3]